MNFTDGQIPSPPSGAPREETPIVQAIAYGIQAPNPHNTQAWKFDLLSETEALLYIDERRLLPVTDPPARQIHIGAGCCIETLVIGMSRLGYETDVSAARPLRTRGSRSEARCKDRAPPERHGTAGRSG